VGCRKNAAAEQCLLFAVLLRPQPSLRVTAQQSLTKILLFEQSDVFGHQSNLQFAGKAMTLLTLLGIPANNY